MKALAFAWCLASLGAVAQTPTQALSTGQSSATQQSSTTQSHISASELVTLKALGLSEADWTRYQSVLVGPQANWSTDKDPLLVLGITASTAAERTRFAELYVEADRKRNAAILEFSRSVQKVWLTKYASEPLFTTPAQNGQLPASPVPLLTSTDRVILVLDAAKECAPCVQAFGNVQRLGRANGGTGVDIYFVNATYEQMVEYGKARGILREDVSAKRVTLNHATPQVLAQLQVIPTATPAVFKRSPAGITRIALTALLGPL